ncbi:MAG: M23 family metallopeptidase [Candidatus Vogelbacteria bacterium]|nr:M23 family metallopeptidase [Candidatus Vogelbacteria bacterium]
MSGKSWWFTTFVAVVVFLGYSTMRGEEHVWMSGYNGGIGSSNWVLPVGQYAGDRFLSLIKFDLTGLPQSADKVVLWLYCYNLWDDIVTVPMYGYRLTSWWDRSWGWWDYLYGRYAGTISAPAKESWYKVGITSLYNSWQRGDYSNDGIALLPAVGIYSVGFNTFYSGDHWNPEFRPKLVITYTPAVPTVVKFKFPLDGKYSQDRITGYDYGSVMSVVLGQCLDPAGYRFLHTGVDLHADATDPVYAIADGYVRYADLSPKWGGYVILEHTTDKTFTTAYEHVIPIIPNNGQFVTRGQQIATISYGNANFDPHLHFGVRMAPYHSTWSFRGRLPEVSCWTDTYSASQEPAFPELFIDPKTLAWE